MYDHPPSPRTSVVALALPATKLQRSHSPIPHISTLLPHHHHHHAHDRQYSPSTRQADVSRLLDPAYASSAPMSSGPSCSRAYVDHRGDLHDPDYRDFPVLPAKRRVTNPQKKHRHSQQQQQHPQQQQQQQRRSLSANPSMYSQKPARRQSSVSALSDRYSTYPLVARPEWERDWVTEAEDLDEDEDAVDDTESQEPFSPFSSSSASSSSSPTTSRRASVPASIYERSSFFYAEPPTISATSSPVGSLEEEDEEELNESPFEDAESSSPRQKAASLLKRMKRCSSPMDQHQQERPSEEVESPVEDRDEEQELFSREPRYEQDDVPSCSYVLRQRWQALSLRLRFGVFHVKRRFRRKTI